MLPVVKFFLELVTCHYIKQLMFLLCILRILIFHKIKKENIFFAGIDFIDQKLNGDINVTSPTGLKTLYDLSGINLAKTFWKELKA